jgi:hypothetical protein
VETASVQKAFGKKTVSIPGCGSPLRLKVYSQPQVKATDSDPTENPHYFDGK